MPRRAHPHKALWEDRFASPTAGALLEGLSPETAGLASELRGFLLDAGMSERVEWCGLPWRWALTYRPSGDEEIQAYLVLNPEAPTVVYRMTHEQFSALPVRKLARHIRDGLAPTRLVAGVCWPEWRFQSANQVGELRDLFGMIHESSVSRA